MIRQDRPLRVISSLIALASGIACFVTARVLTSYPVVVERIYAGGIGPFLVSVLSRASGFFSISLAELLVVALLLRLMVVVGSTTRTLWRRQRGLRNVIAAGSLRTARNLGWGVTLFYVLWGFHYSRPPLADRLGWQGGNLKTDPAELVALTAEMIEVTNAAYLALHRMEDLGRPTPSPENQAAWEAALDSGWSGLDEALPGLAVNTWRYGRSKALVSGRVVSYLGLGGFFFPWTGESNVNADMPAVAIPHSMAHEKAHQRGFAPEDEANFMGFVVGSRSTDPLVRYSAALFAQRQLLGALWREDSDAARRLLDRRHPGVQRDVDDLRAYWRRFEGPAEVASARVNDLYLKSNQVEEGTRSYRLSLRLLLEYARTHGGTLVPSPP